MAGGNGRGPCNSFITSARANAYVSGKLKPVNFSTSAEIFLLGHVGSVFLA